ncbi:MAG: pectinesterase [Deltaproteobacteria bacterium]|nr:pectinesterase [Deltaproteobacteria bacterium]
MQSPRHRLLSRLFPAAALALALAALGGCGDDGAATESNPSPPANGELVTVEPGGDTICSRGTPYRFFAFGGDPKRLVLDFEGGGACWNELTCSIAGAIFSEEAPTQEQVEATVADPDLGGIYKLDDPANPLMGWSLVHIPYCTGDIHWGNATHQYTDDITINHRGSKNVSAVLDWVAARYPDPDTIFVTGCSAGAYGAVGYASWVAERWPNAQVRVLADSGAGIITDTFFADSFPNWNALPTIETYLPGLGDVPLADLSIEDLYIQTAKAYPNMRIGQYNTTFDRDQTFYYTAMGGGSDWSDRMHATVAAIAAEAPNFRYYLAPGQIHCITPYRFFYDRQTGPAGAPIEFSTWLDELINGSSPPPSVACDGDACLTDPICDACAASAAPTEGPVCRWCEGWPLE